MDTPLTVIARLQAKPEHTGELLDALNHRICWPDRHRWTPSTRWTDPTAAATATPGVRNRPVVSACVHHKDLEALVVPRTGHG